MKATQLDRSLSAILEQRRSHSTLRALTTNSTTSVDFSSNDFISFARSSKLRRAYLAELEKNPQFTLGSGGSRLLDGNSTYAEDLERDIAAFHNAPAGLLCNSGFDANAGIFSCLPQPGDIIVYDEYIHASVHDGMRASRAAKRLPFSHNSVSALHTVLESCLASDPSLAAGHKSIFIAVEAIYSMDGDIAPLAAISSTVTTLFPLGNGHLIVDEAHATGVLGPHGRGLVSALGLEDHVLVRLHTFGKALACNGAVILCSPLIRQYLVNYARSLIYTTFLSFPALAAIRASYSLLMDGSTDLLAAKVTSHIELLHVLLLDLQKSFPEKTRLRDPRLLQVPVECPRSPIFSVETSEPRSLANYCQSKGFVVRAIMPPTIPAGSERIRVCLHADNTGDEIRALVALIGQWYTDMTVKTNGPKL